MNAPNHEPEPEDGGHVPEQPEEAPSQLPPPPDQIEKPGKGTTKPEPAPKPKDSVSVFSKIEERKAYLAEKPKQKRRGNKVIGGVVGLTMVGAAALGIASACSEEETPTESAAIEGVSPDTDTTTTTEFNPETDPTTGNIKIARALDTDTTIEAYRPNGETIVVPGLRKDQNLYTKEGKERFMESAFGLTSCYLTTGEQECLEEFSTDQRAQNVLRAHRDNFLRNINESERLTGGLRPFFDWQHTIFDDPQNPAEFTYTESGNRGTLGLIQGDTFNVAYNHEQWQHPSGRDLEGTNPIWFRIQDFELEIDVSDRENLRITDVYWHSV